MERPLEMLEKLNQILDRLDEIRMKIEEHERDISRKI
jgi:hypothetical protein